MYKTRIHQWDLDKKLKEREARAIIHMHGRRRSKATQMYLRGRAVDINTVHSYFKRKRIAIEDVLDSDAISLPGLVCKTPTVSPEPMPETFTPIESADNVIPELQNLMTMAGPQDLESPGAFKIAEMLLADVQEYFLSSFESKARMPQDRNHFDQSGSPLLHLDSCYVMYRQIAKACSLFDENQGVEAYRLVSKELSKLKIIAEHQSCEALLLIFQSIAMLLKRQEKPLVLMLCKQLYSVIVNLSTRKDSVVLVYRRIFSRLSLLVYNCDTPDYLLAAVRTWMDTHSTVLGHSHIRTLYAAITLSQVTRSLYGPEGLLEPLETLQSSLEKQDGPGTEQSALIMTEMYNIHVECGHFNSATSLAQQLERQYPTILPMHGIQLGASVTKCRLFLEMIFYRAATRCIDYDQTHDKIEIDEMRRNIEFVC